MLFCLRLLLASSLLMVGGSGLRLEAAGRFPQSVNSGGRDGAPVTFSDEEVAQHEMGPAKVVRLPPDGQARIFQSVHLLLIVDRNGNVTSATPQEGPQEVYPHAISEAMTWKYLPFEKEGVATTASIGDWLRILPPEDLPKTHQDFPNVGRLAGVVMTLSRSGCYGTCPSYSVEIQGDGTVHYKGESLVVVSGEHRDHLSPELVSELVGAFRRADYFSLKDGYTYMVTDCPTYKTSFAIDGVTKTVTDYVGEEAGMPQGVSDLEQAIDRVAGTAKWISGNAETVPALKREGWDFKSADTAEILANASGKGNSALVKGLLAEGVGASGTSEYGSSALAAAAGAGDRTTVQMLIKAGAGKNDEEMKTAALGAAAEIGDMELVRLFLAYGGDPKGTVRGRGGSTSVLTSAVASGVPEIVEAILGGHPDVNARDENGRTVIWNVSAAISTLDEKRHANRAQVVDLLARAGADLNAQDNDGNSALHGAFDGEVARALIRDGANVNLRNANGETPLMSNFSAEVAKLLVAAGADVTVRNLYGKTALDMAQEMEPGGERAKFLKAVNSAKSAHP